MGTLIKQVIIRTRIVIEQEYISYGSEPPHPPMKPEKNREEIINNTERRSVLSRMFQPHARTD